MDIAWYVLRSKPNKEMVLWRQLSARRYQCFFPQLQVHPVNPRSRRIRPYFPGYMFLHVDIEEAGESLFQWMPFSSGFVSFDGIPATVPDSIVHAIQGHLDQINAAGGEQLLALEPGDIVRIQGGILRGYEAIFDTRLPDTERVRVFLKLLQDRQIPAELSAEQIQRLQKKRR